VDLPRAISWLLQSLTHRYLLTSTPTLSCGTLSPTLPRKPKTLLSPKSAKFANGARKEDRLKHLPSTTLQRFSTSQLHHTLDNSLKTTRPSELSFTRPKHCPQSAPINTTLGCDTFYRPAAFLGPTILKPILPPLLTHTPTPTATPNTPTPTPTPTPTSIPTHPYPDSKETLHTLNLDLLGKPLPYSTAKSRPDRLLWTVAEAEEILRFILSGTLLPIAYYDIPVDGLRDIVYYNPVVKQKHNEDGTVKYRVRGTVGGNLLDVPYDVSARTASNGSQLISKIFT
jgi:hypothetical protein